MTKNEAEVLWDKFLDDYLEHSWRILGDESLSAYLFIEYIYNNNMEIVDRTIDEDTARNLDNELSEGE